MRPSARRVGLGQPTESHANDVHQYDEARPQDAPEAGQGRHDERQQQSESSETLGVYSPFPGIWSQRLPFATSLR